MCGVAISTHAGPGWSSAILSLSATARSGSCFTSCAKGPENFRSHVILPQRHDIFDMPLLNSLQLVVKQHENTSIDELHNLKPIYSLTVSLAVSAVGCQSTDSSRILSKRCEPQWSSRPAEARHGIPAAGVLPY